VGDLLFFFEENATSLKYEGNIIFIASSILSPVNFLVNLFFTGEIYNNNFFSLLLLFTEIKNILLLVLLVLSNARKDNGFIFLISNCNTMKELFPIGDDESIPSIA